MKIKNVNELPIKERLIGISFNKRLIYHYSIGNKIENYELEIPKNKTMESISQLDKSAGLYEAEITEYEKIKFKGNNETAFLR